MGVRPGCRHDRVRARGGEALAGPAQREQRLETPPRGGDVAAHRSHPVLDDLAQAVLFEGQDKKDRMTRFLEKRSRA